MGEVIRPPADKPHGDAEHTFPTGQSHTHDHATQLINVLATQHPHRHQPFTNPPNTATPSADPFTTTSITPVLITGMTLPAIQDLDGIGNILALFSCSTKITAGIGYFTFFVDGASQGNAFTFSSTTYTTISGFVGGQFADALTHVVDLRCFVDNAAHTMSVGSGAINGTSYLTVIGLGTLLNQA